MLHIIPTPLAAEAIHTIPQYLFPIIKGIRIWFVEELKTARRFLKAVDKNFDIDACTFYIINEHDQQDIEFARKYFSENISIGLLSEAGCPAVADPGSRLVALAQEMDVQVVPHVGPNSLLLALMASGFNGQKFTFNGYLPIKNPERNKAIKKLESDCLQNNCTQIFIETPYRNNQIVEEILNTCNGNLKLCIALNITDKNEWIKTKTINDWKKDKKDLHKQPAVFLLGN